MIWKPTNSDAKLIRDYALKCYGLKSATLKIGMRNNIDDLAIIPDFNVLLVTKESGDDWSDTDLDDKFDWSEFREGVTLTSDGMGTFDFWVYSRGYHGELEGQVQAYVGPSVDGGTGIFRLEANGEYVTTVPC